MKSEKPVASAADKVYSIDVPKLEALRESKPFLQDPKYFKNVKISPSATMKMMTHVQSGVEKGIKRSITGKPTEVMGYLIGRQDTEDPNCLIIADAQPLPIEGFETSVVADTDEVLNYQINWMELNALSRHRNERFIGWYHSHPFDVEENNHCYLSNTDVTTQLAWQRSCEKDGDPWLAIVIDPLRSLAKSTPVMESFRVYPPEYAAPANETPDGKMVSDETTRVQLWGACWNRYYKLNTSFYMSSLSSNVLSTLKNNFLWSNALAQTPSLEPETRKTTADRIKNAADSLASVGSGSKYKEFAPKLGMENMTDAGSSNNYNSASASGGASSSSSNSTIDRFNKAAQTACGLAIEQCNGCCSQMAKLAIFGNPNMCMSSKGKSDGNGKDKGIENGNQDSQSNSNSSSNGVMKMAIGMANA